MKKSLIFAFVMLIAGAAGYGVQTWLHKDKTVEATLSIPSPDFSANDINDKPRNIKEWRGKVVLLNFWATWCGPCIEEIPELIKLQKTYGGQGLQVVGVAVDNKQAVKPFAAKEGMNYPILIGGMDAAELSKRYGNKQGVLPFSAFINRQGEIKLVTQGAIKPGKAKLILAQLGIHD